MVLGLAEFFTGPIMMQVDTAVSSVAILFVEARIPDQARLCLNPFGPSSLVLTTAPPPPTCHAMLPALHLSSMACNIRHFIYVIMQSYICHHAV
jgi:hypothetical protein